MSITFSINYNQALSQFDEICDSVIAEKDFVILERGDRVLSIKLGIQYII